MTDAVKRLVDATNAYLKDNGDKETDKNKIALETEMQVSLILALDDLEAMLNPWISESETIIEIFHLDEDTHFVCGLRGNPECLKLIEDDIEEMEFSSGAGNYLFSARYEPAQTGEYGMIEISEHYDLTEIGFKPLPTPPQQEDEGS